jgi:hypothetical protein
VKTRCIWSTSAKSRTIRPEFVLTPLERFAPERLT